MSIYKDAKYQDVPYEEKQKLFQEVTKMVTFPSSVISISLFLFFLNKQLNI